MEPLFGKTFNVLSTMLDFHSERNKVITSNISNLDSADYKSADYVFKEELRRMVEMKIPLTLTHKKHFPNTKKEITKDDFELKKTDEKPDLDKEMTNLAENQLMYNLNIELISRKFKGIKNVLTEAK